jgi:probable F420-dependent oxidoreductase
MGEKEITFGFYFLTSSKMIGSVLKENGFEFLVDVAKKAESVGFDSMLIPEHLMLPVNSMMYDTWTSLAALSALTKRIRLGSCVSPVQFSNPGVMAKRVASVDQISGGRIILGIGCGWYEQEFRAFGIPFNRLNTRIDMMGEAINVIRNLWINDDCVTYSGKHYTLNRAICLPKPCQKPHPPIWLGGKSNRVLETVAAIGDGWIPSAYHTPPSEYREKRKNLNELVLRAHRDPDNFTYAITIQSVIAKDHSEVRKLVKKITREGSHLSIVDENRIIVGTPEDCIEKFRTYANAGVRYFSVGILSPDAIAETLQLYADEIFPNI